MRASEHKTSGDKKGRRSSREKAARRLTKSRRDHRFELTRDLFDVVNRGAVIRRHKFISDLKLLIGPAILSGLLQCLIYAIFILRANRSDWNNLAIVCSVLLIMPVAASVLLAGLRSRDFPFTMSAVVMAFVFNFGVVILSAMRIPVSYTGLVTAVPLAVIGMVFAATRLTRLSNERLAVLDFPNAGRVAALIGGNATVVTEREINVASFDRVLVDGYTHYTPQWNSYLTRAQMRGSLIQPWFSALEEKWGRVNLEHFDIMHLAYSPSQLYYTRIKRLLDIALVILTLPITVPVGAVVWMYIRFIDNGPSLFVQTRRGYAGRNFRMLKFRTMKAGTHGGATEASDDRILPGCRLLRRLRIDELPQIINILRGEMSWIGPRPVSLEIARRCEQQTPAYTARYLVLPGLTGWAQIQYGYAGSVEQELEKLAFDLYYLKRISLDLDLEITFRTLKTVLSGKGAR